MKPAVQEPKPAAVAEPKALADYLGEGVKIAAVQVKVEQQATAATENKHKVAPVVTMPGDYAASEQWKWTPFVFNSHPAKKEELAVGTLVLVAGDILPSTEKRSDLKTVSWRLRKVSSLSKLFQDQVEVSYFDTYCHEERPRPTHVANVRVVEEPTGLRPHPGRAGPGGHPGQRPFRRHLRLGGGHRGGDDPGHEGARLRRGGGPLGHGGGASGSIFYILHR